jgi:ABC-type multidrug transport system ATPase subunit
MEIRLENTGKKFNTEWIFKGVTFTFEENSAYAILGRNGSGKSTLLQVISGSMHPTAGKVHYSVKGKPIDVNDVFRHISLVAPYEEIIEEFTLREMLNFHFSFKKMTEGFSVQKIIDLLDFPGARYKQIRQFSSGMKQRVKLVCALFSDTSLLLLDEPTTNLDKSGMEWYLEMVNTYSKNRTIIICSNMHQQESLFCKATIQVEDYK